MVVSAAEVVSFWREAGPDRWFNKDAAFDKVIHTTIEADGRYVTTEPLPAMDRMMPVLMPAWISSLNRDTSSRL